MTALDAVGLAMRERFCEIKVKIMQTNDRRSKALGMAASLAALLALPSAASAFESAAVGIGSGVVAGGVVAGPVGAVVGGIAGGYVGSKYERRRYYARPYRVRRAPA